MNNLLRRLELLEKSQMPGEMRFTIVTEITGGMQLFGDNGIDEPCASKEAAQKRIEEISCGRKCKVIELVGNPGTSPNGQFIERIRQFFKKVNEI
jgi:hypothetical protein